ncbi:MAG: ABC-2 family transporter protein, partial [Bdellovibrionaceae bacterium]|nr:ABC-2 family transporter protein [Pseudobdellovibrionaceae bacterium]
MLQPSIAVGVELVMWIAIFKAGSLTEIGGFTQPMYLAYVVWAPFLGRIGISWMYESMMVEEVANGNINIILTRPISFYEYYLSQLMGYKVITTTVSMIIPLILSATFNLPIHYSRLPLAMTLVLFYLFLVHNLSFIVSTFA